MVAAVAAPVVAAAVPAVAAPAASADPICDPVAIAFCKITGAAIVLKINQTAEHGDADEILQGIARRSSDSAEREKTLVCHEVEQALRHDRCGPPAQRPEHHARQSEQVTRANGLQRPHRKKPDKDRRQRVAEIENELLNEVGVEDDDAREEAEDDRGRRRGVVSKTAWPSNSLSHHDLLGSRSLLHLQRLLILLIDARWIGLQRVFTVVSTMPLT